MRLAACSVAVQRKESSCHPRFSQWHCKPFPGAIRHHEAGQNVQRNSVLPSHSSWQHRKQRVIWERTRCRGAYFKPEPPCRRLGRSDFPVLRKTRSVVLRVPMLGIGTGGFTAGDRCSKGSTEKN